MSPMLVKERMNMKKKHVLIAAAVAALMAGQVMAQESPWLVRLRAVQLGMTNNWSPTVAGAAVTSVTANDKVIGEVLSLIHI